MAPKLFVYGAMLVTGIGCAARRAPSAESPDTTATIAVLATPTEATPTTANLVPANAEVSPAVDVGELTPWYQRNADRLSLNPSATPEDLSFTLNLIDFALHGSSEVWERMAARVERVVGGLSPPIRPAIQGDFKAEAALYHSAATPHTQKPRSDRDPALEQRLFAKAILLDSSNADLYNHLAIAATIKADFAAAERWSKLAIAVDPTFLSAYQELAYVYKNTERYREAVALVDRAVTIDGDIQTKALLFARKGQSLWMLKEEETALTAFHTSRRLGGPAWVQSYLDGKQIPGEAFVDAETKAAD